MIELDPNVEIGRDQDAVKCKCGGYAERVDPTLEEIGGPFNCGRSYACCVRAFVCCLCKERIVGRAAAPEMD